MATPKGTSGKEDTNRGPTRNLIVILGDQLDAKAAVFDEFDAAKDSVWMAEAREESTKVWSHKARIVMFLAAMRHFAETLKKRRVRVEYHELIEETLAENLAEAVRKLKPQRILATEPGECGVAESLRKAVPAIEYVEDRHFFCTPSEFREWASGKKQIRMEFFYRTMRQRYGYLMEKGQPAGGRWNYDAENRKAFGKSGPPQLRRPTSFRPDKITQEVIQLVNREFPEHPGKLDSFDFPVTADQARKALQEFIAEALPHFGDYQDAMWTDEPVLFHSRLSAAMNLKLLNPREVVEAAQDAYYDGAASLASAEGFIRQIIGWREYVRGVYWTLMPEYLERNFLKARAPLPRFYWTGETDMNCLGQTLRQTLETGHAHHIQRLMVTGLFALLLGVDPKEVHKWYLAIYVDAVEWVELPNTLGMSQYGDGGVMGSKPYVASGNYINRMSNYCDSCKYDPAQSTGDDACPFTTLYWDFLDRHEKLLAKNPRMEMQLKNLRRLTPARRKLIHVQAEEFRKELNKESA